VAADLPTQLDAEASKVNAAMLSFVGVTARRIGALADLNPAAYSDLKPASLVIQGTIIAWRAAYRKTVTDGYRPEAVTALLAAGAKLRRELAAMQSAAKSASPSALGYAVRGSIRVMGEVTADIAKGAAAVGRGVIEAGQSTLAIAKWWPYLAMAFAVMYFAGPQLLGSAVKGWAEGRRKHVS